MSRAGQFEELLPELSPAAEAPPATSSSAAARLELLDGDEIVQLSIKPSLWFIPLTSLSVIVAAAALGVLLALAIKAGSVPESVLPFQLLAGVVAVRLGVATLQWASRLYVLTNRRVMRFKGVLSVAVAERRLTQIGQIGLQYPWYGHLLRLGSVHMRTATETGQPLVWRDIAHPQEIYELLQKAVRKAQQDRPG